MRKATRIVAATFGMFAGFGGLEHGYFEILQGNVRPESIMITSMGPPCVPEEVWHTCEPAMTIIPSFLVTGIVAMALGLVTMAWAAAFVQRKWGGIILALLSFGLLLFGGGICPPVIGIIGGLVGTRINAPLKRQPSPVWRMLAKLWPWALVFFFVWLFGQFVIGYFFNDFLMENAVLILLIPGLLLLSILAGYGHDVQSGEMSDSESGFFKGGLPYNRLGNGSRPLVVFQGLLPENRPLSGLMGRMLLGLFKFLGEHYTVYVVSRRPGLPQGYTLADMANDYAAMVQSEFGGSVDVIGSSTGGSIAQVFAADHPELVNRLVLYSSAYKLGEEGRQFQRRLAELARERRWSAVSAESIAFMFLPRRSLARQVTRPLTWLIGFMSTLFARSPADPSDYVVTIEAEDEFNFQSRLNEIKAPTLVIGGTKDPFYTPELFQETATGIPGARLILYEKAGHGPSGKRVAQDVLAFLEQNTPRKGEQRV